MERSKASENASISFSPGWHLEVADFAAKLAMKSRSTFLTSAIPLKILNLKRKGAKVEMLRRFTNSTPTGETTELKIEVPQDLAGIFKTHCEEFGCDWDSLFIIGAITHILSNSHPEQVMANEHDRMLNAESDYQGVIQ